MVDMGAMETSARGRSQSWRPEAQCGDLEHLGREDAWVKSNGTKTQQREVDLRKRMRGSSSHRRSISLAVGGEGFGLMYSTRLTAFTPTTM